MLEAIRSKVERETQKHQYGNALFWADKAISLGGGMLCYDILMTISSLDLLLISYIKVFISIAIFRSCLSAASEGIVEVLPPTLFDYWRLQTLISTRK